MQLNLPKKPGVYLFKNKKGKILYIGKASNLKERVKQHRVLLKRADGLDYFETDSEIEALILEANLIKKYQPKYNVAWRDDKNYFYVGITKEDFPRVFITHQPQGNAKYIGPFVSGKALKQTLKNLRKIFPYRTCKTLPKKPCLWYELGQCPAPCLLRGLESLRIEAYDISNIQGQQASGAMVTFINGKPDKNFYRRFKIKGVHKPNDVAMIKEILSRRFKHPEWGWPDLILIDGGKAQLSAAVQCLTSDVKQVKVIALAKKKNELYLEHCKKPIRLNSLPNSLKFTILQLRDEAHRFARNYHHKLREIDLRPNNC